MSSIGIAKLMKFFEDMDSDFKAGVAIVAIIAGTMLAGLSFAAYLNYRTTTEAFSKGYVLSYDSQGRRVWIKTQE